MCAKPGLAVKAQRQNAPGGADVDALGLERRGVPLAVAGHNLGGRRGLLELVRIGIVAERFDFGELFLALEILIERLEGQGVSFPRRLGGQYTDALLGASRKLAMS